MSSSQGINVLRYSALAAGVLYGGYHQISLNSRARRAEADREYARKAQLIEQAKAEWKKKTASQQQIPAQGSRVVTDPSDSRFDLEAFLKAKLEE